VTAVAAAQNKAKARTAARVRPQLDQPIAAPEPAPAPIAELVPALPADASEAARRSDEVARAARARSASASEPASLVFGAMQALRREGRPERAAKLLDDYRRRYPNGALAEEALALSVEAAIQRGDPRAKSLADSYLARYPSGQFRKAAERARALFSP
jgi:hypothetical protein